MNKITIFIIIWAGISISSMKLLSVEFQIDNGDPFIEDYFPNNLNRGLVPYQQFADTRFGSFNSDIFINTAFGSLFHKRNDLNILDSDFPITLSFSFSSNSSFNGRFGRGWQFSFNLRYITNNLNRDIIFIDKNDRAIYFEYLDDAYLPNNEYTLFFRNGTPVITEKDLFTGKIKTEYYFESPNHNYITKIIVESKEISFNYDANFKLTEIVTPSLEIINLNYNQNLLSEIEFQNQKVQYFYQDNLLISSVKNDSISWIYEYDEICNDIIGIVRPDGEYIQFEYGYNKITNTGIAETSYYFDFVYDEGFTSLIDFYQDTTSFLYDEEYRISKIIEPNMVQSFVWDEKNYLLEYSNGKDIFEYTYDEQNNLEYYRKNNLEYFIERNELGLIESTRLNEGADKNSYGYDGFRNLISFEGKGIESSLNYDPIQNLVSYSDEIGLNIEFSYNNSNELVKVDFDEISFLFDYNPKGLVNKINLNETSYDLEYDDNNFLTEIHKSGVSEEFLYSELGNFIEHNNRNDNSYIFGYDEIGRKVLFKDRENNEYSLKYFPFAPLEFISPNEDKSYFNFNSSKLLTSVDNVDIDYSFSYDERNRLIQQRKGNNLTQYEYDINNRIVSINQNNLALKEFRYNVHDSITFYRDFIGNEFIFRYNDYLQIEQIKINDFLVEIDCEDPLNKKILFSGLDTLSLEYDEYGKLLSTKYFDKYQYLLRDDFGNLIDYRDNINTIRYQYFNNALQSILYPNTGKRISYTYDNEFQITNIIEDNFFKVDYEYNKNGLVTNRLINKNGLLESQFNYDRKSRLNEISDASNVFEISFSQIDNIREILRNNQKFLEFEYNNTGNIINIINHYSDNVNLTRNPNSLITRISSSNQNHINFIYDNNLIDLIIDGENNEYDINYDRNNFASSILLNSNFFKGVGLTNSYFVNEILYSDKSISIDYLNGRPHTYSINNIEEVELQRNINNDIILYQDYNKDTTFYFYDEINNLNGISKANYSINVRYDRFGNPIQIIDESSQISNFDFNAKGTLLSGLNQYSYLETQIDANLRPFNLYFQNKNTQFEYDDNVISIYKDPDRIRKYNFDIYGNILEFEDGDLYSEAYLFDEFGRILNINFNYGNSEFLKYDNNSNLIEFTDKRSIINQYIYDNQNRLSRVKFSDRDSINFFYNSNNQIKEFIDENNNSYRFVYDNFNRLNRVSDPILNDIDISYTDKSIRIENPFADTLQIRYDLYNRIISTTENSKLTNYYYNSYGLLKEKQSKLNSEILNYEDLNLKNILANGSDFNFVYRNRLLDTLSYLGNNYDMNYDLYRRIKEINKNSSTILSNQFDYYGNLITIQRNSRKDSIIRDYFNNRIEYFNYLTLDYDDNNNPVFLIDGEGNSTGTVYDYKDRPIGIQQNGNININYDNSNNIIFYQNASNKFFNSNYDGINRLISKSTNDLSKNYNYMRYNEVVSENTILKKNSKGQLKQKIISIDGIDKTANIYYNSENLLSEINTDDLVIYQTYNSIGKLEKIRLFNGDQIDIKYNSFNLIERIEAFDEYEINYFWRTGNRIDSISLKYNNNLVFSNTYFYDNYDRITTIFDNIESKASLVKFDDRNRIEEFNFNNEIFKRFTYDKANNIVELSNNSSEANIQIGKNNKLLNFNNFQIDYNQKNVTQISSPLGNTNISYDVWGFIERIQNDTLDLKFEYDNFNNLIKINESDSTWYINDVYDDNRLILTIYDKNIKPIVSFVPLNIEEIENKVFLKYDHSLSKSNLIFYDISNLFRITPDNQQNEIIRTHYDPYGNVVVGENYNSFLGFRGKYLIPNTDFLWSSDRIFFPKFYRFLQANPKGFSNTLNLYELENIEDQFLLESGLMSLSNLFNIKTDIFENKFNPINDPDFYSDYGFSFLSHSLLNSITNRYFYGFKVYPILLDYELPEDNFPLNRIISEFIPYNRYSTYDVYPDLPNYIIDSVVVNSLRNNHKWRESFNAGNITYLEQIENLFKLIYGRENQFYISIKKLKSILTFAENRPDYPSNIFRVKVREVNYEDILQYTSSYKMPEILDKNLKNKDRVSEYEKVINPFNILDLDFWDKDYSPKIDIIGLNQLTFNNSYKLNLNVLENRDYSDIFNFVNSINNFNYQNKLKILEPINIRDYQIGKKLYNSPLDTEPKFNLDFYNWQIPIKKIDRINPYFPVVPSLLVN